MEIKVMLDENAKMPEKAHPDSDAGFDIFSPGDFEVPPTELFSKEKTIYNIHGEAVSFQMIPDVRIGSATIDTGVHMQIPHGYVGMIKSKSGLNVKHGLTSEGVVDAGYTGSIVVKIYNHTRNEYKIRKGDKLTQIVILPIPEVNLIEVGSLDETERGENGFGSTGR